MFHINLRPYRDFFRSASSGGIILMVCLVISMIVANSPLGNELEAFLATEVGYSSPSLNLRYSILLWVNDGLMAIFFLLVGLEIKRELVEGELSSLKKASFPVFAALGGMLIPAGIYALLNQGTETASGWGIPMATDIAFAIGILSLLGRRVPLTLKVFLTALAIVDDLGAILVIAIFYSKEMHVTYLLYAAGIFAMLMAFNKLGVKSIIFYLVPGVFMWYFIHHSGVHATIAGVLTAFTLPTTPGKEESPLERLEHALTKPVNFLIMPIFALANTNIAFESTMIDGLYSSMGLGIILGLFLGKPLGIFVLSYISVKTGISDLPKGVTWTQVLALSFLAGIGFTMSIFVALLSFSTPEFQIEAKFSILVASLISGLTGYLLLRRYADRHPEIALSNKATEV